METLYPKVNTGVVILLVLREILFRACLDLILIARFKIRGSECTIWILD
jgi:hypothetical protein